MVVNLCAFIIVRLAKMIPVMKASNILYLTLLALLPLSAFGYGPQVNDEYTKHIFTDSLNNTMPYRMLAPGKIEPNKTYPLVLFLHGSGERGNDNEKQLTYGASIFSNPVNADKYPAFVVFPQCKERAWTDKIDERTFMPGAPIPPESKSEEMVMALIDNLIKNNPIDKNRIYIVGISMGGIATYDLVCRYPQFFTAAVPICGAVNPERLYSAKDVKFMIFHGEDDEEIPSICGREAYKALNSAGADVDYIEFAGIGHDCWSSAFNYPTFLPWLFSQKKEDIPFEQNNNLTYIDE